MNNLNNIKELYDAYKKTETFEELQEMVKKENPNLFLSSIELILYSYWHENEYKLYCNENGLRFVSLLDEEVDIPEAPKGEIKCIGVSSKEEVESLPKIKGYEELIHLDKDAPFELPTLEESSMEEETKM